MARPQSRDQRYQLTQTTTGSIMDYHYGHDPAGNIISISGALDATVSDGTTTSSHDGNRLTEATGQEPAQYTYDDNGNTVSDGTRTFVYNQNNRLIRVEEGSTVLGEYGYDGLGRRVKKTVSGTTTQFHYDPDGNLIAETASDGTPLRDYIYQNGERVAMRIYGAQAGTYYFLNDHLGTPRIIINDSGQIVWQAAYLPFGKAQVMTETIVNNFRLPGQYFDAETGLHYNWHRYYDPSTGRYLTPDPIGLEGGINLFIYVQNDPVNWIDPYGLGKWQFHKGHHGGDHFQKGNFRYDAKTLKPIPHKGKIPSVLSKSTIKNLKGSGAWAKYLKLRGKVGGGALTILLELALPAEAHAPTALPPDPLLMIPPSINPLPLIPLDEESKCQ